ncbi:MAG: alpha/beta fold hydrolase [Selenomonadaceae bacterium]|nr:alpha/beta fold hydrolase [Selenomonadaceae bacterium]
MIIHGAESFFLPGDKSHGVLLIHGFTGNPAEMLLLGKYLQSKNFSVLGVRLAGHGTNERDLIRTTKDDWLNSVVDGFSILKGCCDKVSIVGHSMGAILTLNVAENIDEIFKLVTLSAPIFIDESLGLSELPTREKSIGRFARKFRRKLKNVPIAVNKTYRSMPLISIHELIDLIDETKKNLSTITAPILILHGKEDHTAKVESAKFIFDNVSSSIKDMKLIDGAGHLLPLIDGREKVFEMTADFLKR